MPFKIHEINFQDSNQLISAGKKLLSVENFDTNKKLFNGDHWRDGSGWTGPKPDPTKATVQANVMTRIKRQFVSKNVVKEVIKRHVNALFGNSPSISIIPNRELPDADETSEEEQQRINEIEHAVGNWIKDRRVFEELKRSLRYALYGNRSVIRFYIPSGFLDPDGRLEDIETLEDAMNLIYLDVEDPDSATVYTDEATKREVGIFKSKDMEDEKGVIELSFVLTERDLLVDDEDDATDFPDFGQLANVGKSFIVSIKKGEEDYQTTEPIELHGNITMFQVEREPLITPQVIQNQDLLNKTLTMWSANLDWSGFVERIILNGMPPGEWKKDTEGDLKYEQEGDLESGPSTTAFISGVPKFDEVGNIVGAERPSVVFRDPINPETFRVTRETSYVNILEEVHQSHILLQAESGTSGISRREARQDYIDDIKDSKLAMDLAGNWLVNTLLYLSEWLMGEEKEDIDYRANFRTHMTVGAVTKEDIDMLAVLKDHDWISDETAMSRAGIDDVEAEKAKIDTVMAKVEALLNVLDRSGHSSPTLIKELYKMLIADVDILNKLDESIKDSIIEEFEQSAQRKTEESDFMSQIRGGV